MSPHSSAPAPDSTPTRRWRFAWWAWFGILFVLSSIPGHRFGPMPFDWFDKVQHVGFFFFGGLLLGGWIVAAGRWPSRWWLVPLMAAAVGAFDETHQRVTPGRSGLDLGDWIADIMGGLLAALAVAAVIRWRRAARPDRPA